MQSHGALFTGRVILCVQWFIITDHYILNKTSVVTLSAHEVITPISCREICVTSKHWTFITTEELNVRIAFQDFFLYEFYEYLEIGDGLIVREDTRLAHFTGIDLPSNVTSITSAAWIAVHFKYGDVFNGDLTITITVINNPGIHSFKFFVSEKMFIMAQ